MGGGSCWNKLRWDRWNQPTSLAFSQQLRFFCFVNRGGTRHYITYIVYLYTCTLWTSICRQKCSNLVNWHWFPFENLYKIHHDLNFTDWRQTKSTPPIHPISLSSRGPGLSRGQCVPSQSYLAQYTNSHLAFVSLGDGVAEDGSETNGSWNRKTWPIPSMYVWYIYPHYVSFYGDWILWVRQNIFCSSVEIHLTFVVTLSEPATTFFFGPPRFDNI